MNITINDLIENTYQLFEMALEAKDAARISDNNMIVFMVLNCNDNIFPTAIQCASKAK